MWSTPALIGTFGDAFIEGKLDNARAGLLPWTFVVLNHTFQRTVTERTEFFASFSSQDRSALSDVALVFRQSRHMFRQLQKVKRYGSSSSQLLSFLRKLRKSLRSVEIGESLLLPLLLEAEEMLLVFTACENNMYRLVVVNTNAERGLKCVIACLDLCSNQFFSFAKSCFVAASLWRECYSVVVNRHDVAGTTLSMPQTPPPRSSIAHVWCFITCHKRMRWMMCSGWPCTICRLAAPPVTPTKCGVVK